MASLRSAKQALRKEIKKLLAAMSDHEKLRQSQVVSRKLFQHPKYLSSQRIAVFLNMHDEVHTEDILQDIFKRGKVCFIPRYFTNSSHMDMLRLNDPEDINTLAVTSWNIRQPGEEDTEREEALTTGKWMKIWIARRSPSDPLECSVEHRVISTRPARWRLYGHSFKLDVTSLCHEATPESSNELRLHTVG
ncbi:5,10-methenyltetrahydrofolate synthetase (5-formyltetrahydrofolate cyclo-ligase) isoform X3 [Myxocyprinus asiaticus]|uniref:5,10-methenyltetrahydrofolate synthetase (5-formyltetrahydrofolate cyclo-ligase) isoform X3 n=1 Tax=Myxocyprinus asiaticus TaxID=70543 RepID=UPI0022237D33|nr:5,10-methenyltetrahydrofolate synthetase (5-formyltetrahydrofolate cyclo-ligase) isoform X3 [Myxocyprinus asiaticus]